MSVPVSWKWHHAALASNFGEAASSLLLRNRGREGVTYLRMPIKQWERFKTKKQTQKSVLWDPRMQSFIKTSAWCGCNPIAGAVAACSSV